jgi:hypothetical protein
LSGQQLKQTSGLALEVIPGGAPKAYFFSLPKPGTGLTERTGRVPVHHQETSWLSLYNYDIKVSKKENIFLYNIRLQVQ